ncbi:hypothetical protein CLAFUW4_07674 [Fulvia fulva]|nr:hypothetical protein CLAFUR4_07679 [Fulvia fulva]WPV12332.1 hypothetical protein CLAFUW4_07674 [Fulvia fulva]WPV27492.1 hypothetical protein CLAFUW7_07675 [Fulvia fulva]
MSRPGATTMLGLLYEGSDFEAWKERLRGLLQQQDLDLDHLTQNPHNYDAASRRNIIIRATVSESVLTRLRTPAIWSVPTGPLLKILKRRAQPFRFLDLPAELRNHIYELALPHSSVAHGSQRHAKSGLPALLHTSSKIRRETLSIYFEQAVFRFVIPRSPEEGPGIELTVQHIKTWAKVVVREHVTHLRHVELLQDVRVADDLHISAHLDTNRGLGYCYGGPAYLDDAIMQHTSETRNRKEVKGEDIIAMLTTNLELWKRTTTLPTAEELLSSVPPEGISLPKFRAMFRGQGVGTTIGSEDLVNSVLAYHRASKLVFHRP